MITKVEISSAQGGFLSLPLTNVLTGFPVQNIDGLDPVKATLVSTTFAQQNGAQYQSSKREPRNLTLTIGLEPNWDSGEDVSSLRKQLYKTLMPQSAVALRFFQPGEPDVILNGIVESFESALFSKDPAVDVVIIGYDPDFIEPDLVLMEEDTVTGSTNTDFMYLGTVETGILFKLLVNRSITGFTIYHQATDGIPRSMLVSASAVSGDVITISTVSGNKFATKTHAGVDSSILYGVAPQASWFELLPGLNSIRVEISGAAIPYTIEYVRRYGGL